MRKKNMKLRKKTLVYGLVATMMLGLCGCGEKEEKSSDVKYDVTEAAYQEYEYEEEAMDGYVCQDATCADNAIAETGDVELYEDVDYNTNEYDDLAENSWMSTQTSPFSTFGADVDTASYTNIRYNIMNGQS